MKVVFSHVPSFSYALEFSTSGRLYSVVDRFVTLEEVTQAYQAYVTKHPKQWVRVVELEQVEA